MKSLVRLLILLALVSISLTSAALTEGEEKFVIEHDAIPYQLIDTESIHEFKDICDTKKEEVVRCKACNYAARIERFYKETYP